MSRLVVKGLVGGLMQTALYAVVLLVPAGLVRGGTWHWARALAFLALYGIMLELFVLALAVAAPASLAARLGPATSAQQPEADRVATALLVSATLAWFVFVALDVFAWRLLPRPSFEISVAGAALSFGGLILIMAAIYQNSFAIPIVEDQTPRAQVLIDSGLYGSIRHPMYLGIVVFHAGLALWLQSYAGLVAVLAILLALLTRIAVEEDLLRHTLTDYPAYAARVRYRLVPLIW